MAPKCSQLFAGVWETPCTVVANLQMSTFLTLSDSLVYPLYFSNISSLIPKFTVSLEGNLNPGVLFLLRAMHMLYFRASCKLKLV